MNPLGMAVTLTMVVAGVALVYAGVSRPRPVLDVGEYFRELDESGGIIDEYERKLSEPFAVRVLHPLGRAFGIVTRLTPANYVERIRKQLLHGGLANSVRAEEFVVGQVALTVLLTLGAIGWVVFRTPSTQKGFLAMILLPLIGFMLPSAWLARNVRERQGAILKDLPDTLDLLAISVEAGMGFEGALDIVCQHFRSPLADELHRTLREMELGLPRKDAFHNLKRRTEVPELSNFVLALLQADALGIPIGRVLRTQATEMRAKRRQWAREKAAKLPVKMLLPLVFFIFPSIMVVVLGPAASGFVNVLK